MASQKLKNELVRNINEKQLSIYEPIEKEYIRCLQEIEKLKARLNKTWDAYMDEMISKVAYVAKSNAIENEINELKSRMEPLQAQLQKSKNTKVSMLQIEQVLGNFLKAFNSTITREQRKRLLQLLIHQITIGEDRKIDSIQLKLNTEVLEELQLGVGESSLDGPPAPFSVLVAI